jgi:hypothetical protein
LDHLVLGFVDHAVVAYVAVVLGKVKAYRGCLQTVAVLDSEVVDIAAAEDAAAADLALVGMHQVQTMVLLPFDRPLSSASCQILDYQTLAVLRLLLLLLVASACRMGRADVVDDDRILRYLLRLGLVHIAMGCGYGMGSVAVAVVEDDEGVFEVAAVTVLIVRREDQKHCR